MAGKGNAYIWSNKNVRYNCLHGMNKTDHIETDTESRILQAAEEEFLLKGLEGARTTTIAERAGVTHAMLHYYFRTKAKLFEQIISRKMQGLGNMMLSVFVLDDGDMPLVERIRRGVECHFDYIAANPSLPRFVIQEIYTHPERHEMMQSKLMAVAESLLGDLQQQIDENAARGETVWVDARMLILDIVSLNMFAFISYPLVKPILGSLAADEAGFLARRKAENVETILRRIKIMNL